MWKKKIFVGIVIAKIFMDFSYLYERIVAFSKSNPRG